MELKADVIAPRPLKVVFLAFLSYATRKTVIFKKCRAAVKPIMINSSKFGFVVNQLNC